MKNESIVFFSSDDWGWKTSKYQLSTRFAKDNKVLFVSSIGFRAPTASSDDLKRIWKKLAGFFKGIKKVDDNLYVLTPLVVPFSWFPFRHVLNNLILRTQVGWAKWKLGMKLPYMFVFSENWHDYVINMKRKKLIYYTVDEQASFSGLDGQRFIEMDKKLNKAADVIFCSARTLYDKNIKTNENTHYMPHGVSYSLFSSTLNESTQIAEDIKDIPHPLFLFFGHISHDWVDKDLVKFLAKEKPEWSWVYVGRYSMDENEFSEYQNIHLLGEKEFNELPGYCKGADFGTIPFVYSKLTNNCNPLKLPEYFSAGLPVISTNIPEVERAYGDECYIGKDNQGFLDGCEKALAENNLEKNIQRSKLMAANSWEERINNIYKIIQKD